MTDKPFTPNEPYQCRGGMKAGITGTCSLGFTGIIISEEGWPVTFSWFADGRRHHDIETDYDLINTPEPSKAPERVWCRITPDGTVRAAFEKKETTEKGVINFGGEVVEYVRAKP